jgi:HAD superfamily hydrolase (TIGR01484 family)
VRNAVLLDIDSTLTPPRQPLPKRMAEALSRLAIPFHVVAGSSLDLLQDQFFKPLFEFGFRGRFHAFLCNGADHYLCDYSNINSITPIATFDFRKHLGQEDYDSLINILQRTLELKEFYLPPPLRVLGDQITLRGSMLNFCPIGRAEREGVEETDNRLNFIDIDQRTGYRKRMLAHLRRELDALVRKHQLTIVLGGQTSFDIGIAGRDKASAVRSLLASGVEEIVFLGDALFENGNDAAIQALVDNWPASSKCPLKTIQVGSWQETIVLLSDVQSLFRSFSEQVERL